MDVGCFFYSKIKIVMQK